MIKLETISSYSRNLPEYHQIAWADRQAVLEKCAHLTPAKQKLMAARLELIEGVAEARADSVAPDSIFLCPHGSFIFVPMRICRNLKAEYFFVLSFIRNEKATDKKRLRPFKYNMPMEASNILSHASDLCRTQEEAKPFVNPLKEGDVLYSLWGSEQTNVSFYSVISTTKTTATVRAIAGERQENDMRGTTVPLVGQFTGEEITRKVFSHGAIKVNDCESAAPLEYTTVAGMRVYKAKHFTSYA